VGPDPPPWRIYKFYRFLTIFTVLGAFNRAGKSVSKIGIYALPPLKSGFYGEFIDFGIIFASTGLIISHRGKSFFPGSSTNEKLKK
jgi:hypothetical protein